MNNTQDLRDFGYRELDMAGDLLKAYKTPQDKTVNLGTGVRVELNPNSGNVFLVDKDYNVAIMDGDELKDWYSCAECGNEGFDGDEYDFIKHGGYCSKECAGKNK